jgi:hypothetical protein
VFQEHTGQCQSVSTVYTRWLRGQDGSIFAVTVETQGKNVFDDSNWANTQVRFK